jgi:dTDP-4-amino-4,6-dideoxygalactose transaminase
MKRLNEIINKRNIIANLYNKLFLQYSDIIKIPTIRDYCTKYSRFIYVIEIKKDIDIKLLIDYLKDN